MARPIAPTVTLTSGLGTPFGEGVRLGRAGPRPVGPGPAPRARRHPRPGGRGRRLAAGRPSPDRCLRTARARSSAGRRAGRSGRRLTPRTRPAHTPRTSRTAGCERDEYPSRRRPRDPAVGASRNDDDEGMDPGASGPNARRREPRTPVGSGAERQRYRAAPIGRPRRRGPPVGHESAASPNEGGTAEGTTFRPGDEWSFLILRGQPR